MTKTALMASALAGCMLATLATASVAEAGFNRGSSKAHKHHRTHKYVEYRIRHKYAPKLRQGHRPDCRQFSMRAKLTGNAYWAYAAHSCRHDNYPYAY